jgi:hypothetical protein
MRSPLVTVPVLTLLILPPAAVHGFAANSPPNNPGDIAKAHLTAAAFLTCTTYFEEMRAASDAEYLQHFLNENQELNGQEEQLLRLLGSPPVEMEIVKLRKFPAGASRTNPYLANRPPVSYIEVLQPMEIGRRVLEIRAAMASDLRGDLDNVEYESQLLLREYHEELEGIASPMLRPRIGNDGGVAPTPFRLKLYNEVVKAATKWAAMRFESDLRAIGDGRSADWLRRLIDPPTLDDEEEEACGSALVLRLLGGEMVMIDPGNSGKPLRAIEPVKMAAGLLKRRLAVVKEMKAELGMVNADHKRLMATIVGRMAFQDEDGEAEYKGDV